ncbi:hybrid sensor histidine kinase/response regulator transcription factor [Zobellia uliginosa]|uniref:hybrid sensor histidine kinase/response regulator transcription factor n=1 Tax=Zobellia uliginosa TaxID=143224 RepID=UPI0026E443DA|nr:two-component regulator propeller domain-containing protein [Zobellia uliginosa]MDO6518621.1 two-component regulator propeller domain-containing protein [Zobellia uliginosa]
MPITKHICLFLFLISFTLEAQFNTLKFENFETPEGLSSSTCSEIFQDREGFLWFGTIDGLNRYNGYEFEIFRSVLNDTTSISNNRINTITEDKYGKLWVGTNNGLNVYDKETDKFTLIDLYGPLSLSTSPRKIINDVEYDEVGNAIWVATENGVVKIDLTDADNLHNEKFSYYLNDATNDRSIDSNGVNAIVMGREGELWITTDGQYLNKYNRSKDDFDKVFIDSGNPYELNHIPKRVFIDDDGDFLIGNDMSDMIFWIREKNEFQHLSLADSHIPVSNIYQDDKGVFWLSTDGHGIFLYNKKKKAITQQITNNLFDPFSLANDKPSIIYEDRDGILWIGSYDKGVSKLDPSKYSFGHYYYQPNEANGLSEKIVQSVLQDSKGRIWLGAYNGGLDLFDEKNESYRHYGNVPGDEGSLSSTKILYTFESSDGKIWICTLDGGLNSFDPEKEIFTRYEHNVFDPKSIDQNSVWAGLEDFEKRIWIGLRTEGLNLLDPKTGTFYKYKNTALKDIGLTSNIVLYLYVDSKKRLLIGTTLGLNVVALDRLKEFAPEEIDFERVNEDGVEGNRINYITEDHKGNIWLGTDSGIFVLDDTLKRIRSYSSLDGLPNNLVVGLEEDDNHNFWITSKSGLSFLNPETDEIRNFNVHDGLQGSEFQTKSIDKTKDGRILAGGINGFNIFHPDNIKLPADVKLNPLITSFKLNNKKVVKGDSINGRILINSALDSIGNITLKYDENYISFEFVALYFENPEQVQYAYKMHGLDDDFVNIDNNRVVNHSNLQPGNYVFEVKASVDGKWENAGSAKFNIEILPPFWKTWWMYLIYAIAGGLLIWAIMHYYTQKVREDQKHELDQMKLQFFVNVSHEFRTPLTLILNPVDKILSSINESSPMMNSAQTIQRSARRLLHLVNQLLDYRKMDVGMMPLQLEKGNIVAFCEDIFMLFKDLADQKDLAYTFTSDSKNIQAHFDLDKVEKIITNLISNAIKFTPPEGAIEVSINKVTQKVTTYDSFFFSKEKMGNCVEIVVKDSGKGLDKVQLKNIFSRFYNLDPSKTGTGIGLNFSKALVEMHGGDISVESQVKKGSKFKVRLPLNLDKEAMETENVKNEFRINSMKAVEYEMLTTNELVAAKDFREQPDDKDRPTVLVVEDNKELRTHLVNDLREFYQVKQAANGEKGLKMAKKHFPDIIISDVMMPVMDGFELCKNIKNEFETCHIPVLLLTAKSLDDDRIEGYHSGADGYLSKPFVTRVLIARINNLLETKKRLRQRFSEVGGIFPASEVTNNSMDEVFLDKVTKTILDNVGDMDFKQEDLLKELGIGRSQLYRKINSLTGKNPSYYMRTVRLRYASELLKENKYSIKEVSYMTGFNSTAYFSKTFRELFGVTPTEFIGQKEAPKE